MTGELLALLAAFAFGFANAAIAKGAKNSSGESGVLLSVLATGLLAGIAWLLSGGMSANQHIAPTAVAWYVASGLLATVGGRITLYKSVELAGVVRASMTRRLIPFLSLLLSWLVFNETVSIVASGGMTLIALSFAVLLWDHRSPLGRRETDPQSAGRVSRGLALGVASAVLYSTSMIARSLGLAETPDAFLGALIGSIAGLAYYALASAVSKRYRQSIASLTRALNPWQLLAALAMAVGQIALFGALLHAGAGLVAFISSLEVYVAAFLAIFVFRIEPTPSRPVVFAMFLATAGVLLTAIPE